MHPAEDQPRRRKAPTLFNPVESYRCPRNPDHDHSVPLSVPSCLHAALRVDNSFAPCAACTHDPTFVSHWLRHLGLAQYVTPFANRQVTPAELVTLNSPDLRALGVRSLAHRRTLLAEIARLRKEPVPTHLHVVHAEHGRILTHLSNERLALLWARFCLIMQIAAVATIRINADARSPWDLISVTSVLLSSLSIVVVLYAAYRYLAMVDMCNYPPKYRRENHFVTAVPVFLIPVVLVVTLYAVMLQSKTEAAMLALLFI